MSLRSSGRLKSVALLVAALTCVGLPTAAAGVTAPGALVRMQMSSKVGLLLDEIPAGPLRDRAAETALSAGDAFWIEKAQRQIRLASYRLVFRGSYYDDPKGPLPLPPKSVWNVSLKGKPHRQKIEGHDYIAVDFTFQTNIVADKDSPGIVEPALRKVGGAWPEPLILPVDPDLLLERTGYACMDEVEFPPGSVFEENTWYYYDQTCDVETPATSVCHVTEFPRASCVDALTRQVGKVRTNMNFTRLRYDPAIAAQYRVGTVVNPNGASLAMVQDQLAEEQAVFYRYFGPDSCEIVEGAIGAPGWRRLLAFSASVRNDGTQPIHMGDPTDPSNPWVQGHTFVFSACHHHNHFTHYGTFRYGNQPGSKKAFCLEDTNRYHNNETTSLVGTHQSCGYQGITPGWGDEYNFGIPGQWVDITDVDTRTPMPLSFQANPDQFLCEGQTLDRNGNPVDPMKLDQIAFVASGFVDENNDPVLRNSCAFANNWYADNTGTVAFSAPPGSSFVTQPCTRGQTGPLRDCGFRPEPPLRSCEAGKRVRLQCESDDTPKVLRVCEISARLGVGVACAYRDSLANAIVGRNNAEVSFACPAVRDDTGGAGGYSIYEAPVLSSDPGSGGPIRCTLR